MIKAVIFDKDGVLIDTEPTYQKAMNIVLSQFGTFPEYTIEDRKKDAGIKAIVIFDRLKKLYNLSPSIEELTQLFYDTYFAMFEQSGIEAISGVKECIQKLKKKNILVAVATGSGDRSAQFTLQKGGFTDIFDVIVTASHVKYGKPHPESFLRTADRLNVHPERCIVIGDSINDQKGSHAARMKFVLFAPNYDEGDIPYDMIIRDFRKVDIEKLLLL